MSTSDAAVRAGWRAKLKIRRALLAFARRQAAFWRKRKAKAAKGSKAYSHAGAMLADRERKVSHRASQVAYAERVLSRHAPTSHEIRMFDSVDLGQIPKDAPAVAGYTSGHWPTYPQLAKRWPHAHRLSIAVTASHDADCLDVEPGDATPGQAAAWVKRQHARGIRRPVVYTSVSSAQNLIGRLSAAGIKRDQYRLWTAHYTHKAHRCSKACGYGLQSTADATQWTDKALGRNLDESLCGPGFFS